MGLGDLHRYRLWPSGLKTLGQNLQPISISILEIELYIMRAWTVLWVLSILLLSTAFPMILASAQEPTRSINIQPLVCKTPDVLVNQNTSVKSSFETLVGIDDSVDENVFVELNATNDMDWPTTVVPQTLNFTMPGHQKVNITITIPAGIDASVVAVVKLFGYAHFPTENTTASAFSYLYLKQTFGISINYEYTKRSAKETWVRLRIHNDGNGEDTYECVFLDGDKLDKSGITVDMSRQAWRVYPSDTWYEVVHVKYQGTETSIKFDLRIKFYSLGAPQKGLMVEQVVVIPLSFKGPDPPMKPNVFAGIIVAFVIVIVIVLAVVVRGPAKKSK
jgi:hypothetical protein